ncbi:PAS domain S-box protein [Undibacterium sp. TJN19]|uniref:hybrid sensor histidine kinase/response regulator n=1 Tax=Undibacterium sp. TJN19 TaxID=3413055 RepID=UPI003BF398EE
MNPTLTERAHQPFLNDTGDIGKLVEAYDWGSTPLGEISYWSAGVKAVVAMMLRSPMPMVMLMGVEGVMIYNEGYATFAGPRHPQLLGMTAGEGWPEVAEFNAMIIRRVFAGERISYTDQEFSLNRKGTLEQVFLNLDYSAVSDEHGVTVAVLVTVVETTAKVKADRWMAGERQRLQAMFEQTPGFTAMLTGPQHVFALTNRAYSTLVNNREVLGKSVKEAIPEAADQGFVDLLDKLYATGEIFEGTAIPFVIADSQGNTNKRFLDFVYQPLKNDAGEVFGIFVQGFDVTDRVVAEKAMVESEALFRTLAQAVPNQVWIAAPDGLLYWFNDRVYDYSGARPGELDGEKWATLLHPDELAEVAATWTAAVTSGEIYQTEFRIRQHDGNYHWHLVRALPIRDEKGEILRWIGTNTDIHDQKSASQVLTHENLSLTQQISQRTEERDRMWRLATDIMVVADIDGNITSVNPAFSTLLGWKEGEVTGVPFVSLIHPDEQQRAGGKLFASSDGNNTFKFEKRVRRADGAYSLVSWTGARDAGLFHAVGRDVTAERAAAAAMKRTEQALIQSQKMDTIGKLTGGVAHDFNNLLQVISGNLQLLTPEVRDNPRALRKINNALDGVSRGAKLASYLLAFGRRQALEPKVVKVSRYIVAMEDMLRRSLGEAIDIEMVASGGLWNCLVDVPQLENAILNLCINARDAMEANGKLTIEMGNVALDDDYAANHFEVERGQYIMIAVSDTGSGMTPEVIAQAFEPFFSTKPEGKGTGLGLSMVYGFVKQSGGHVKIYSEVGLGTTVKLYLPRSMAAEEMPTILDSREVVGGEETILVVEDDVGVRKIVVEMLGGLGYRVLQAGEAEGALAIVQSGLAIDLLFTDVVMPGPLRSPDLAREARGCLPDLAVLFTSGYTENAIVHGGRLDAGVELLGKPYTRAALAQKIRHVLGNQKQRKQTAAMEIKKAAPVNPANAASQSIIKPEPAPPRALHILLVEDDDIIRANTTELLSLLGHRVSHTSHAEQALKILSSEDINVLIADIQLPGMSGETLANQARASLPELHVVFASGQPQQTRLPGAVSLIKPYDIAALVQAIEGAGR